MTHLRRSADDASRLAGSQAEVDDRSWHCCLAVTMEKSADSGLEVAVY